MEKKEKVKLFQLKNIKYWDIEFISLKQDIVMKILFFARENNLKNLEAFTYDLFMKYTDEIFHRLEVIIEKQELKAKKKETHKKIKSL